MSSEATGPVFPGAQAPSSVRPHIVNITTPPSWVEELLGTPRASVTKGSTNMLELLVKLYTTSIHTRQTSPMPHIVGPPGCGKSYTFQQLADLAGVNLHIVNVSRINPLGLEGLEMPVERNTRLKLLVSELWTKAKDGDIYLFDEFLRGFPEVYNGLLDIFTAREVAGHKLPNVFIAGASNSVATYDGALEDRLLHIPVADPRSDSKEHDRIARMIIDEIGLSPEVRPTPEMAHLMSSEVLPTYELLDKFDRSNARPNASSTIKGTSPRKLIGQARLRHLTSTYLTNLISENNRVSERNGSFEHVILVDKSVYQPPGYEDWARAHHNSAELSAIQRQNLELNLQLIEMEAAKKVNEQEVGDDNLAQYPLVG